MQSPFFLYSMLHSGTTLQLEAQVNGITTGVSSRLPPGVEQGQSAHGARSKVGMPHRLQWQASACDLFFASAAAISHAGAWPVPHRGSLHKRSAIAARPPLKRSWSMLLTRPLNASPHAHAAPPYPD